MIFLKKKSKALNFIGFVTDKATHLNSLKLKPIIFKQCQKFASKIIIQNMKEAEKFLSLNLFQKKTPISPYGFMF